MWTPYAVPVITVTNTTGKITASRVVIRGPLFSATEANKIPAKQIWPEAREDLMVSLLLDGSVLNFSSNESPNISDWIDLRTLNGVKFTDVTAGRDLSAEEADSEDGVKTGACVRVTLQVNNIHTVNATL